MSKLSKEGDKLNEKSFKKDKNISTQNKQMKK